MAGFILLLAFLASIAIPIIILVVIFKRFAKIERRLTALEHAPRRIEDPVAEPPAVHAPTVVATPAPPPMPSPPAASLPRPETLVPRAVQATVAEPVARKPAVSAEEIIGGIWLQNVGAILLLLGLFFLILWGYTTGRFGPGVLITAGVVLGIVCGWRGHVMSARVPAFGHTLIGIGLGTVYLSIYLGHFALNVLHPLATTVLLGATSLAGVAIGDRYRVQWIAILAVLGSFVPQVASVITGRPGFVNSPELLLVYLGLVNLGVFALAGKAGWRHLVLLSLALTTFTWVFALGLKPWSWPVTIGLAVTFLALGLARVPFLARRNEPLPMIDAATIALAPCAFVVTAWPFLWSHERVPVGILLLALAIVEGAAALWVDRKRELRDLFNILATAAVVFLTAAFDRLLGPSNTALVWTVEGVALLAVGVAGGSTWLRFLASAVAVLGTFDGLPAFLAQASATADLPISQSMPLALLTPTLLRYLVIAGACFVGVHVLQRERNRMPEVEGILLRNSWLIGAQVLLFTLSVLFATRLAAVVAPGANIRGFGTAMTGIDPRFEFRRVFTAALIALAWTIQAGASYARGIRREDVFGRVIGAAIGMLAAAAFLTSTADSFTAGVWHRGQNLLFHPAGLLQLGTLLAWGYGIAWIERRRSALGERERVLPVAFLAVGSGMLWLWLVLLSQRLASQLLPANGGDHGPLGGSLAALAWAAQSFVTVWLGVRRNDYPRRVIGYVLAATAALSFIVSYFAEVHAPQNALPGFGPVDLAGLIEVAVLLLGLLGVVALSNSRAGLRRDEEYAPEAITIVINGLWMLWSSAVAGAIVRTYGLDAGGRVTAVVTSAAWILQAVVLSALGWTRKSAFLRWLGLGLFGITLAKVALFDLANVDVFWRFLLAVGMGAVLLAISYVYQRLRAGRGDSPS